jgi:hypothetical protein
MVDSQPGKHKALSSKPKDCEKGRKEKKKIPNLTNSHTYSPPFPNTYYCS